MIRRPIGIPIGRERRPIIEPPESFEALRPRVRGLAPWSPQRKTRQLIAVVMGILAEYQEHLPLTIRQVFYRLVGAHGYPKTENAYGQLCDHLSRARRAGFIPWEAIRDDGTVILESPFWFDDGAMIADFIDQARDFRLDRQENQDVRIMFAVEAAGMAPFVNRIADRYGIQVHSSGGFDSLTAKYGLAVRLSEREDSVEVLHIGDHDPSGVHLFSSMAEDIERLAHDIALGNDTEPPDITFTRLAVTQQQMFDLNLSTAPAKNTDRRNFAGPTTQVEAIPPDVFAEIIQDAIASRVDDEVLDGVLAEESVIRRRLLTELDLMKARYPIGRETESLSQRPLSPLSRRPLPPPPRRDV
jgi:hypothetical protein